MSPLRIAFGPEAPAFGSWEWLGADLVRKLALPEWTGIVEPVVFQNTVPDCDVAVFIKFKPPLAVLRELSRRCRIVFCPVDVYGSAAEIDGDSQSLQLCDLVIVHCRDLVKYFAAYSQVEYLDHHLKFIAPLPDERKTDGPILWTGNRANLPPLLEWVNRHSLPEELWVLADLEPGKMRAADYGFSSPHHVRIEQWTPEKHIAWAGLSRAAIDIKGLDFHKCMRKYSKIVTVLINCECKTLLYVTIRELPCN